MDIFFKDFLHVGCLPRRFPSGLQLDGIGYQPHKQSWVRRKFNSYNFSFILNGGGEYWSKGVCWQVQAPCVLTQSPWSHVEYGPAGEYKEWEEFFLMYADNMIPSLERMGLIRRDVPVWSVRETGLTRSRLLELHQLTTGKMEEGFADRVDRLSELMVMDSILGETDHNMPPEDLAVCAIRDIVAIRFREHLDFNELARAHGLSASTFRKYWGTRIGMPPARYAMRMRINEACRLLVETHLKVGEIAATVGFSDPLHFSRRFRQETGVTAVQYRQDHLSPLSLTQQTSRAG